ncbi:MAG TPA: UDP-N-acetylmuramoyl-L-alanyl-D-glutamate--2,6-diaminopimelate ligase [Candidatus Limnocylindrales bacterium]|nr:UDP-N-acetylmuramoyl-L-alanyl-D-glutamate--2,6-diaminopimelate ligase [Candidatus Limnocylindrales bacterium]
MTERTTADLVAASEPFEPRPLGDLVARLEAHDLLRHADPGTAEAVVVRGISYDSRRIRPGAVFVAVAGDHVDGHAFAGAAVAGGAVGVVVESPISGLAAPQIVVASTRRALADAACWWYGDPSHELSVVGITGTDGKTTTSYLAAAALDAVGLRTGLVGTIETRIGGVVESDHEHQTTPEPPELQAVLRAMVAAGDTVAIVETTSHGLALDRVGGVAYDAAVFTNLSHEHLDLHGTYESYRDAKLRLFEGLSGATDGHLPRSGIVNGDDAEADRFAAATRSAGARLITYGLGPSVDVRGRDVEVAAGGCRFAVTTDGWDGPIALRIGGRFNVHNALAVVALGRAWGLDPEAVREGIESVPRIPGRMEPIAVGQPFDVVVDFAHSPASLGTVLDELVPLAASRGGSVVAVFGSAGERDTAKRPLMGRIAGERCRIVVLTDEDPRGEDGAVILDEIAAGAEQAGRRRGTDLLLIRDRRAAIAAAFERARPGDIVLLAGKGHERSIIGPDGPAPWDEAAVAREILRLTGFEDSG